MRFAKTIIGFGLFVAIACLAQVPYHNSLTWRAQQWKASVASQDPTGTDTIQYRWVASDLTNSPVSAWVDRIKGKRLIASTNQPTWATNAVQFNLAHWLWVENGGLEFLMTGTSLSFCLVMSVSNTSFGCIFVSTNNNSRFFQNNGTTLIWEGSVNIGPFASGVAFDILRNSNSDGYTNNILYAPSPLSSPNTGVISLGRGNSSNPTQGLAGKIHEFLVWTNSVAFTPTQRALLHNYVTNTYKFISL